MRKFSLKGDEMSEVPWLMIELDMAWIIFDFQSKSWILSALIIMLLFRKLMKVGLWLIWVSNRDWLNYTVDPVSIDCPYNAFSVIFLIPVISQQ